MDEKQDDKLREGSAAEAWRRGRAEALERAGRAAEAVRFVVSDGGADTA